MYSYVTQLYVEYRTADLTGGLYNVLYFFLSLKKGEESIV